MKKFGNCVSDHAWVETGSVAGGGSGTALFHPDEFISVQKKQGHRSNSCGYTSDSPMDYPGNSGNGFFEAEFSSRRMARSTQRLSGKTSPDPQRSEISFYTNVGEPRVGGGSRSSSRQNPSKDPHSQAAAPSRVAVQRMDAAVNTDELPLPTPEPRKPSPPPKPKVYKRDRACNTEPPARY